MKKKLITLAVSALCLPAMSFAADTLSVSKLWTYNHASTGVAGQTSEISAYDKLTNTVWVAGINGVDVLNATSGSLVQHIDTTAYGSINSVAIHNGLAAFAIESTVDRTSPGVVKLFDTSSRALTSGVNSITVGALPDMLTFTADGSRLLVANEATPTNYAGYDPAGSVSIINMTSRSVITNAGFTGVPTTGSNIRTNTGMDYEPEYIAVNKAGTKAYVSLQEANAIGVLDLNTNSFSSVIGLGTKDFSQVGNWIDPNHKDGKIELRSSDVKGLYQPDAMAAYEVGGKTFIVMANEGDTREDDGDKARVKDVPALKASAPADLKELNISVPDSTPGNLVTFGARSFSIRDASGAIVFDSGNQLDAKAIELGIYDDSRSDDKGVEPEGVALLELGGRTLAFIGLERTLKSAVAIYDVTDPTKASFLDMIVTDGDVAPEGLMTFVRDGKYFLAIANEVSGTTSVYGISGVSAVPEAQTYGMLLLGMGLIGFVSARRKM
jgi:DNA-binding beta-propeller fold protein YncE